MGWLKEYLCSMGICPRDSIRTQKEWAHTKIYCVERCPICGEIRYKQKTDVFGDDEWEYASSTEEFLSRLPPVPLPVPKPAKNLPVPTKGCNEYYLTKTGVWLFSFSVGACAYLLIEHLRGKARR
jgi:hypothetical protein